MVKSKRWKRMVRIFKCPYNKVTIQTQQNIVSQSREAFLLALKKMPEKTLPVKNIFGKVVLQKC